MKGLLLLILLSANVASADVTKVRTMGRVRSFDGKSVLLSLQDRTIRVPRTSVAPKTFQRGDLVSTMLSFEQFKRAKSAPKKYR